MSDERERWRTSEVVAYVWWCGDEQCDCTEPVIVRVTPNLEAGYPWVRREALWTGQFLSSTFEYSAEERERLQYAPLRAACSSHGVPIPEEAAP